MKKLSFDVGKEISVYTSEISRDIRSPRRRKLVKKEYTIFLEHAVHNYMLEGHREEDAFRIAREELGDVKTLQRTLVSIHNKRTSKLLKKLAYVFLIAVMICMPRFIPHFNVSYSLQSWLTLFAQLICIGASIAFLFGEYKYIRGVVKRVFLVGKIKRICKENGYDFYCTSKIYTEWNGDSHVPSLVIQTKEKTYAVRFIACLKRNDTYTFTDINSYFTTTNFNPILWSNNYPVSLITVPGRWLLPRFATVKNDYVKDEVTRHSCGTINLSNAEKILCIHPIAVNVQVVHTNRGENIFDGDVFKGHTVYSGSGLCEMLRGTTVDHK